jgi:hypothetical protein
MRSGIGCPIHGADVLALDVPPDTLVSNTPHERAMKVIERQNIRFTCGPE